MGANIFFVRYTRFQKGGNAILIALTNLKVYSFPLGMRIFCDYKIVTYGKTIKRILVRNWTTDWTEIIHGASLDLETRNFRCTNMIGSRVLKFIILFSFLFLVFASFSFFLKRDRNETGIQDSSVTIHAIHIKWRFHERKKTDHGQFAYWTLREDEFQRWKLFGIGSHEMPAMATYVVLLMQFQ